MIREGTRIVLQPSPVDKSDSGGLKVSFLFLEDAVRILIDLAARVCEGMQAPAALNVAGPEGVSIRSFSECIGRTIGREPVFTSGSIPRTTDLIADIGRLRSVIDPEFTPLADAVDMTFRGAHS